MQTDYSKLFNDALADVEAGRRHACLTNTECRLMSGCAKCGTAVLRGAVPVGRIEVNKRTGVVRLTVASDHGHGECLVSFCGVEVDVQE